MKQSSWLSSIILVILLVGCSHSEQTREPNLSETLVVPKNKEASKNELKTLPSPDLLTQATDIATGALNIAQSAQSQDDWTLAIQQLQEAINLLKAVPASSPNKKLVSKKLIEYQRHLANAQRQSKTQQESSISSPVSNQIVLPPPPIYPDSPPPPPEPRPGMTIHPPIPGQPSPSPTPVVPF